PKFVFLSREGIFLVFPFIKPRVRSLSPESLPKKSHAVMKIGEINKINTAKYLPAISLTYDESYKILEEEILDKFGKMPTFDEYFKSHIEDISTELKESFQDSSKEIEKS
ncbi:hypothetical protein, partial [Dapis sp. BLCC M229]|uniref:hypothetical protein n=1 Tax=Dapis sp. BLCC M229 TaxID=3400188 RepID=UPI003CE8D849